jgi:glycine/D-amino acid oxidase-like deaminating enzyme
MMTAPRLPTHIKYLIIGAGVHGLSTAYHLALELEARGKGSGQDILVIDKTAIAAGASGIACGVVRNNYFQPAMRELMAECVSVWESDQAAYHYHPVGYIQVSPDAMRADVASIAQQQRNIGYESVFIEGAAASDNYMKGIFGDWQAKGITSILHEKKGGYANNRASMEGLANKARGLGVRIVEGVKVTGFRTGSNSGAVTGVDTSSGPISCEKIIVGAGPWVPEIWKMLDLPPTTDVRGPDGKLHRDVPMWTYWCLEEGTLGVDPSVGLTNDGRMPPVIHVDTDAPLYSDVTGKLITDKMWGIYYKPDFNFNGIQGGGMPYRIDKPADRVAVDPYGTESQEFITGPSFREMWCSALAFCHKRYEGKIGQWKEEPSGGIGAFTPDNFPVFDQFRETVYVIADSNHGYKMIGVGKLVAQEILGSQSRLLEPFRISRFASGKLHPTSNSPFPWS